MTAFGPTGQLVYERTYSRVKPDGSRETWPETVRRVVDGNLGFVDERYHEPGEREALVSLMEQFKIIPAGRHLWTTGVKGRQFVNNCWVSHWDPADPAYHFRFTLLRLMEGGGVGANYSARFLDTLLEVLNETRVHIVCDDRHADYAAMRDAGVLSDEYDVEWPGSFEVEDSREGWADALGELVSVAYRDGVVHRNRVFDVSRVRAAGSRIKTSGGTASGPWPLAKLLQTTGAVLTKAVGWKLSGLQAMEIDHAIGECVVAGGSRRSARMSIMHWADPEILEFIGCKATGLTHWTTNISVETDAEFHRALANQEPEAMVVKDAIVDGMYINGEPGIWNSSLSNTGEPNEVVCTNPCGEIALEPWEQCNLGHVNLDACGAFRSEDGELEEAHRLMTRFLIRATFSDIEDSRSEDVRYRNRRIGVGHLGYAAAVAKAGIEYGMSAGNTDVTTTLRNLRGIVALEAIKYAHQLRIPVPVKTTTVAPTGTIAKMPGTTEGIHPVFARHFIRRVRLSTLNADEVATAARYREEGYVVEADRYAANTAVVEIPTEDSLYNEVKRIFGESAAKRLVQSPEDIPLHRMLAVQEMYQKNWADNAVSFTINFDPTRYTADDLEVLIRNPYVKGVTAFPEMGMPQSPYQRISEDEYRLFANRTVADSVDEDCASGACPVR